MFFRVFFVGEERFSQVQGEALPVMNGVIAPINGL